MSIVWFLLIAIAYNNGYEISRIDFLSVPIFYIGDSILSDKWLVRK